MLLGEPVVLARQADGKLYAVANPDKAANPRSC